MSISITPQTSIRLVPVTWNSDNKHTLYFNTPQARESYFNGLKGLTVDDYTYIKKESSVKVGYNIELLRDYNYCYYCNYQDSISDSIYDKGAYSTLSKSPLNIYCYIVKREYINENTTKLYLKTDVLMTYMFSILADTTSISYIERQHIAKSQDTVSQIRGNIVQENIDTGEYVRTKQLGISNMATSSTSNIIWPESTTAENKVKYGSAPYFIIVGCTQAIFGANNVTMGRMFGNIYSGLTYYGFGESDSISSFISYLNATAQIDAIFNMFMIPKTICNWEHKVVSKSFKPEGATEAKYYLIHYNEPLGSDITIMDNILYPKSGESTWTRFLYSGYSGVSTLTSSNSYEPHNNKLYTYPFCYLQVLNGESNAVILKFEQFDNPNVNNFVVLGILAQGGSIVCYPKNYNGKNSDFESAIQGPKFPTCSWNTDSYTNWLTQTAVTRSNVKRYAQEDKAYSGYKAIKSAVSSGVDLLSGDYGGAFNSALSAGEGLYESQKNYDRAIDALEEQKYIHSLVPDSINNGSACPEVLYSNGNYEFKIQLMTVTGERAKQIDEYFDRFGYKVNRNANLVQAITSRSKWNYIKTAECNIKASIPDEALEEIKAIFNNGVTYWKNASEMYRYDLGGSNN